MIDARRVAADYVRRGWAPVPIPPGQKAPRMKGWNKFRVSLDSLPDHFEEHGNVGVLLGDPSAGLVDIDLDCDEAITLAPRILPETGSVFGRASKPQSHWIYICPGAKTVKIQDGRETLVELRSTGGQTVFPGSTHPSGEVIWWDADEGAATVTPEELTDRVRRLAEAARLVRAGAAPEWAAAVALEADLADTREPPRKKAPAKGAFREAVERYNSEHRRALPKSGGTCPGCGHNGCFGAIPDTDPPRWYCFSAGHTEPGIRGQHGYHGDMLSLDAHRLGETRAGLLKREGYIGGRESLVPPPKEKRRVKQVVLRPVKELIPPSHWKGTIDQDVVKQIAESLKLEGLRQPITVLVSGHIVHGIHRWAAAQHAGIDDIECVVVDAAESTAEHKARVIVENLARRHLFGAAREELLAQLVEFRSQYIASNRPGNASEDFLAPAPGSKNTSQKKRKRGRPKGSKSSRTRAVEQVASEMHMTPSAVKKATDRAMQRRADKEPRPQRKKKPTKPDPHPPGLSENLKKTWDLLTKTAEDLDSLLRQAQAKVTRVVKQGEDLGPGLYGDAQRWREELHTIAHQIRDTRPVCVCLWCRGEGGSCKACRGLGLINQRTLDSAPPELRGEAPTAKDLLERLG